MTNLPSTVYHLPLVVITGPTASGKSGLAMELAEKYDGEIICADSRTVYKGMDIGTAKPSVEDQQRVRHHLLDVVNPGERFTAAMFKELANIAIADIRQRGRIPLLVGGTGLYIDGVVLDLDFQEIDQQQRDFLETLSVSELQSMLISQQKDLPHNSKNKRHLINKLMRDDSVTPVKTNTLLNTNVVAIATKKSVLEQQILRRAHAMFETGVVDEAAKLANRYGWESEAMTGNIYPILHDYMDGKLTKQAAIDLFVIRDRQLAKRQITWLKRHEFVQWLSLDEARDYLSTILDRI